MCHDAECFIFTSGTGCHCQNTRDGKKCYAYKENKRSVCEICLSFGVGKGTSDNGAAAGVSLSQGSSGRTPQKTDRYAPEVVNKKRKTSVSAVATVVADTGLTYWDHLERAKSALDKGIITQEDYDDLKQHYMKKLKEM